MTGSLVPWLWIPITVWAALAQTVRNAAQRHLTAGLGTLGATLVRFLYGLPFAVLWLAVVAVLSGDPVPVPNLSCILWGVVGAVAQIVATALLLRVMEDRNFTVGVAWSKTEIIQVAIFGAVLLGDPVTALATLSIVLATAGVVLFSFPGGGARLGVLMRSWASRTALLGLASGSFFAISAVGYRGAALALLPAPAPISAAVVLVAAQAIQVLLLGGWILWRDTDVMRRVVRAWRTSLLAGLMGTAASAGWFTAMAMEPVAHVRTVGLVELLFSYVVSRRVFDERLSRTERIGLALVTLGLVGVVNAR